jgi:hypothetical protein
LKLLGSFALRVSLLGRAEVSTAAVFCVLRLRYWGRRICQLGPLKSWYQLNRIFWLLMTISFSAGLIRRNFFSSIVIFSIVANLLEVGNHIFTALFTRGSSCNREISTSLRDVSRQGWAKGLLVVPSHHGRVVSWVAICLHWEILKSKDI